MRSRRSSAKVVWLRADPAVLAERATRGQHRPLLDGDPLAAMQRLLPEREPLYRAAADLVVDTDAPRSRHDRRAHRRAGGRRAAAGDGAAR